MSLDIKVTRKQKNIPRAKQTKIGVSQHLDTLALSSNNKKLSNNLSNKNKKYIWWLIFIILLIGLGFLIVIIAKDSSLFKAYTKNSESKSFLDIKDSKLATTNDKKNSPIKTNLESSKQINLDILVEDLEALNLELEAFDQFNTVELKTMQDILLQLK